jgi:uncharacterized protein YjiS (DUF1127 family)
MHRCQPTAAAGAARGDGESSATFVYRIAAAALQVLRERRRAALHRRELRGMGEHMLRDVGLGRDGAEKAWFD